METRKLQEVGGGTYTISVPKEWAREHGVEAGAELYLSPRRDGSLVVRTAERDRRGTTDLRLAVEDDDPGTARRSLLTAHAAGFDTVTLAAPDGFTREQRRAVTAAARELAGTEIVAEGDGEITARNLLDAADVSVRQSVVQLGFAARSLGRDAAAALVDADGAASSRLEDRETEIERLRTLVGRHCYRSLTSLAELDRLDSSRPALFDYDATAGALADAAREGATLARLAGQLSGPPPDGIAGRLRDAADGVDAVLDTAAGAVLDGRPAAAHAALDRREEVRTALDGLEADLLDGASLGDRPVADRCVLVRAVDALARSADCGGAIARIALRAAVRAEG